MSREYPTDLADLIDPVDIPGFELQYDAGIWKFPGAKVSTKVYGDSGCHLDMGQSLLTLNGAMLSLAEHTALLYLAMANYQGKDMKSISPKSISGATSVFNNNLTLALTNSNEGASRQYFMGEAHNDLVELSRREGDYVSAVWYPNPLVKEVNSRRYTMGKDTISSTVNLPLHEGVAIKTDQGYLDPKTGMPYQTDPSCREHSQMFLSNIAREVLKDNGESDPGNKNLFGIMCGPRELIPIFKQGYDLTKIGDKIAESLQLLKPVFRISHNSDNKPLNEQSGGKFVSMRGIDEISDFFVPVLGYVGTHCGMQPRSIERYSSK